MEGLALQILFTLDYTSTNKKEEAPFNLNQYQSQLIFGNACLLSFYIDYIEELFDMGINYSNLTDLIKYASRN